MGASALVERPVTDRPRSPRILVFSTNNISDPGIDLAGSSHRHYPPTVMTLAVPCTSGIKPAWIRYAINQGFDGVFIASDGDECAYLPDCSQRASRIVAEAQRLLLAEGSDPKRVRMAAVCSVCAEPFAVYMREFAAALAGLSAGTGAGPSGSAHLSGSAATGAGTTSGKGPR